MLLTHIRIFCILISLLGSKCYAQKALVLDPANYIYDHVFLIDVSEDGRYLLFRDKENKRDSLNWRQEGYLIYDIYREKMVLVYVKISDTIDPKDISFLRRVSIFTDSTSYIEEFTSWTDLILEDETKMRRSKADLTSKTTEEIDLLNLFPNDSIRIINLFDYSEPKSKYLPRDTFLNFLSPPIDTFFRSSIGIFYHTDLSREEDYHFFYEDKGFDRVFHIQNDGNVLVFNIGNRYSKQDLNDLDPYLLIKESEFNILNLPNNSIKKFDSIECDLIRLKSKEVKIIDFDCESKNVQIKSKEKNYEFDLGKVLSQIQFPSKKFNQDSLTQPIDLNIIHLDGKYIAFAMSYEMRYLYIVLDQDNLNIISQYLGSPKLSDLQRIFDFPYFCDVDLYTSTELNKSVQNEKTFEGGAYLILSIYKFDFELGEIVLVDTIQNEWWNYPEDISETSFDGKIESEFHQELGLLFIWISSNDGDSEFYEHLYVYDIFKNEFVIDQGEGVDDPSSLHDETNADITYKIEKIKDKIINPLLVHLDKIDKGVIPFLSVLFDQSPYYGFFDKKQELVSVLVGDKIIKLKIENGQVSGYNWIKYEGTLSSVDFQKGLVATKNSFKNIYDFYHINPPKYLLGIKFTDHSVSFTDTRGNYSEFYNFKRLDKEEKKDNRPDNILEIINPTSKDLNLYKAVYSLLNEKKADTLSLKKTPIVFWEPTSVKKVFSDKSKVAIEFIAMDSLFPLESYRVEINGVPQSDINGHAFNKKSQSVKRLVNVELSFGTNIIEIRVKNNQGIWSNPERIIFYYFPEDIPDQDLLFIGIGFSEYMDQTRNLNASGKDIRDVVHQFRNHSEFILIDTIINQQIKIPELVQRLNSKLRNSKINDKVILLMSGHGLLSADKLDWHFATYSTDFSAPEKSETITFDILNQIFEGVPARNRLILVDACHAGQSFFEYEQGLWQGEFGEASPEFKLNEPKVNEEMLPFGIVGGLSSFQAAPKFVRLDYEAFKLITKLFPEYIQNGITVVTASRGEQTAKENVDNGFFTKVLLDIFKSNEKGTLGINQLIDLINTKFKENPNGQTPSLKAYNPSGNWIVW